MYSDVSSLSDWMCSRSLFDRSLERPRVDADVDAPKRDGSTPLLIVALWDQRDIVKFFCESRADANKANQDICDIVFDSTGACMCLLMCPIHRTA